MNFNFMVNAAVLDGIFFGLYGIYDMVQRFIKNKFLPNLRRINF